MEKNQRHPVVYIAGKLQKSLRRYDLLNFTLTHSQKRHPRQANLRQFTYNKEKYDYSGPYIEACHETCTKSVCKQQQIDLPNMKIEQSKDFYQRSLDGIQKADYVIAWLEDNYCYQAINELGHASALNKKIFIAHSPKINPDDFWFVFSNAKYHKKVVKLQSALRWLFREINKDLNRNPIQVTVQVRKKQTKKVQNQANEPPRTQVVAPGTQVIPPRTQVVTPRIQVLSRPRPHPQLICTGCIGKSYINVCQLKKKNITHCFICGQRDFQMGSCPKCTGKKIKLN